MIAVFDRAIISTRLGFKLLLPITWRCPTMINPSMFVPYKIDGKSISAVSSPIVSSFFKAKLCVPFHPGNFDDKSPGLKNGFP